MTLTEVGEQLTAWKAAYLAVSKGQTFSMNGRSLTRSDADACWAQIVRLERLENRLRGEAAGRGGLGASVARF